jgi:EF-hand domain-containing protein 1
LKADGSRLILTDLAPGNSIHVLGREIFINDCDNFTRDYFRKELDLVLSSKLNEPSSIREDIGALYATGLVSVLPAQKSTFGSQSFSYIEGQAAKDRMNRYFKYDGKVFRFLCVDIKDLDLDQMGMDKNQLFVPEKTKKYALAYFLADRSIDIRCVKNNSGLSTANAKNLEEGMLVMKRSKIAKNWRMLQSSTSIAEPQYYEPQDLQCGHVIDVYGRGFLLINCDNYTRSAYLDLGFDQIEVPLAQLPEKSITHPIPKLGDGFMAIGSEEGE